MHIHITHRLSYQTPLSDVYPENYVTYSDYYYFNHIFGSDQIITVCHVVPGVYVGEGCLMAQTMQYMYVHRLSHQTPLSDVYPENT